MFERSTCTLTTLTFSKQSRPLSLRCSYMKKSMSIVACKKLQPVLNFPGGLRRGLNLEHLYHRRDRVVIIVGATGTGKSRLSIDLATQFRGEVVNSDKIQVYEGLDIVTNKVTPEECRGIPHHLLGIVECPDSTFTAIDFRNHALRAIKSIIARGHLPIIAGGSNSFIDALVNHAFRSRYDCCFIWVDVAMPVLHSYVSRRVDRMVEAGLVDEVRSIYAPEADNSKGIRRAIGVSEMEKYLRCEGAAVNERTKTELLEEAISSIKENTRLLACRQREKIRKMNDTRNWNAHRIDATEVFLKESEEADEAWERVVTGPCTVLLSQFLYGQDPMAAILSTDTANMTIAQTVSASMPSMITVAAATH